MRYPSVGDKVKAIAVPLSNWGYLTPDKLYTVIDVFDVTDTIRSFSIISDRKTELYCLFPRCAHATWEIVE